jgi:hypothetical protein
MIAFLPLWILGVPLVLLLVDLVATRSGAHEDDYDTRTTGRYTGVRDELQRREEAPAVVAGTAQREHPAVNVS